MTKRVQAKYKINRRLGLNLWGRPKNKKEYGPGQHGQRRKKTSDYGLQLMAKQKLKGYYGNITERQFRKIYAEAVRRKGDTGQNLVELLERRLDAAVYRLKFAPTVFAARQLVSHGHARVNGRKVDISSYTLKDGDVIELKDKAKQLVYVMEALASQERQVPDYYQVGGEPTKGTFVRGPKLGDVPYPVQMEPNLVIEFYSR